MNKRDDPSGFSKDCAELGNLTLTPEHQAAFVEDAPEIFLLFQAGLAA
jgi:hypothetical protein